MFDPFSNTDPRWEPHQLEASDEFSQVDMTARSVKDFLRSLEPPIPPREPSRIYEGRVIDHIQGYPN